MTMTESEYIQQLVATGSCLDVAREIARMSFERAYGADYDDNTRIIITPRDERRYVESKEYDRLIAAGVGHSQAYAAAKAYTLPRAL